MIGIFDSGVGGLTVVKEIFKYLPDYQIIYFGDTARLPYGTKGEKFVKKYSDKITEWLLSRGAGIIVIACYSSSSWASDFLKKKYKDIQIFEMITPAVKQVLAETKNKRVGVIGTPGTIKSGLFKKKIIKKDSSIKVFPRACPLFVPLAEEGLTEGEITGKVIKKYLTSLKNKNIDSLALACTHYPLLKKEIAKFMGKRVKIINPAEIAAKEIKLFLANNKEIGNKIKKGENHQFFFSDEPYNFKKISRLCFKKEIKIKIIDPFND